MKLVNPEGNGSGHAPGKNGAGGGGRSRVLLAREERLRQAQAKARPAGPRREKSRSGLSPPARGTAWKAGIGIALALFAAIAWLQPRTDLEPALAAARTWEAPTRSLAAYPLPPVAPLPAAAIAPASAAGAATGPAAVTEPPPATGSSVERRFFETVRASGGGAGDRGAAGGISRLAAAGASRSSAGAGTPGAGLAAATVLDATRRTSVTIREEAPKAPPPKPSIIVEQPRAAYRPKPVFPPSAVAGGKRGAVRVRLLVAETGAVEKSEILEATPPGVFEGCVKEALSQWRFIPARDDSGKAVRGLKELSFIFDLQGGS